MDRTSVSLKHLVRRPHVDTGGKPPLLLLLHGYGSNEQDLFGLTDYLDDRFLVVAVRAPVVLGYGAYAWYPLEFTIDGISYAPSDAVRGRESAEKALGEIVAVYDADPLNATLLGFSQGAMISLGVTLRHPDKVAAAAVLSGGLMPDLLEDTPQRDTLAGKPLFVAHGTADEVLPIASGRAIKQFLASYPVRLDYREYPMAHTISPETLTHVSRWLTDCLDETE